VLQFGIQRALENGDFGRREGDIAVGENGVVMRDRQRFGGRRQIQDRLGIVAFALCEHALVAKHAAKAHQRRARCHRSTAF
jgi:hypothetical protein